jgi:hypothetical protein
VGNIDRNELGEQSKLDHSSSWTKIISMLMVRVKKATSIPESDREARYAKIEGVSGY